MTRRLTSADFLPFAKQIYRWSSRSSKRTLTPIFQKLDLIYPTPGANPCGSGTLRRKYTAIPLELFPLLGHPPTLAFPIAA